MVWSSVLWPGSGLGAVGGAWRRGRGPQALSPLLRGWPAALPWPRVCPGLGHTHLFCACINKPPWPESPAFPWALGREGWTSCKVTEELGQATWNPLQGYSGLTVGGRPLKAEPHLQLGKDVGGQCGATLHFADGKAEASLGRTCSNLEA